MTNKLPKWWTSKMMMLGKVVHSNLQDLYRLCDLEWPLMIIDDPGAAETEEDERWARDVLAEYFGHRPSKADLEELEGILWTLADVIHLFQGCPCMQGDYRCLREKLDGELETRKPQSVATIPAPTAEVPA